MLIQSPDIARKLQRKLRLQSLPDSVLSPETVGVIVVEDLSAPLIGSSRGCMGSVLVSAVAGEYGHAWLYKTSTQYNLTLKKLWLSSNTAGLIYLVIAGESSVYTPTTQTAFLNRSIPGRPSAQLVSGTDIVPRSGTVIWRGYTAGSRVVEIDVESDLGFRAGTAGFDGLFARTTIVNVDLVATFLWVESDPLG